MRKNSQNCPVWRSAGSLPAIAAGTAALRRSRLTSSSCLAWALLILIAVPGRAAGQVVAPAEIKDVQARKLQEKYLDQLKALASELRAQHYPFPFYFSRLLDIDEKEQRRSDQRSIRFDKFHNQMVLEITGNYYAAYSSALLDPVQRAQRTFRDVILPILDVTVPHFAGSADFQGYALEIAHHVRSKVLRVPTENAENFTLVVPRSAAERLIRAKTPAEQDKALAEAESYLNAKPLELALAGDAPDDQAAEATGSAQAPPLAAPASEAAQVQPATVEKPEQGMPAGAAKDSPAETARRSPAGVGTAAPPGAAGAIPSAGYTPSSPVAPGFPTPPGQVAPAQAKAIPAQADTRRPGDQPTDGPATQDRGSKISVALPPAAQAPAAVPAPPEVPAVTQETLDQLQTAQQETLSRLVRELDSQAHFVAYAPPSFIAFHRGVYLQLSFTTTLNEGASGSQYKLAALAFDTHVSHLIRPVLKYFQATPGFDGIDFSTSVRASGQERAGGSAPHQAAQGSARHQTQGSVHQRSEQSSEAVEFILPFSALHCFQDFDCTGQQLLNAGFVLINGERVGLDLQTAEGSGTR